MSFISRLSEKIFHYPKTILTIAVKNFFRDDCLTVASSISFVFILSIIPFSTLSIVIASTVQNTFFPSSGLIDIITNSLTQEIVEVIPFISADWVRQYIVQSDRGLVSYKLINILLLPIASGLIFKTLEKAYRRIFKMSQRHLLFTQILYSGVAIFIVLLLFISSFTLSIANPSLQTLKASINKTIAFNTLSPFLDKITGISTDINYISLIFILIFYFVTIKVFLGLRIKKSAQLSSALLFCFLWETAKYAFQFYLEYITKINIIYGSLSSIIIILLWIFYASMALLFSIELLYTINSYATYKLISKSEHFH